MSVHSLVQFRVAVAHQLGQVSMCQSISKSTLVMSMLISLHIRCNGLI
jgi:hypothetical protein